MTATAAQRRVIKHRAEVRDCKYRITRDGEVHFYGLLPNTNSIVGWYLFARSVDEAIQRAA